jgi:hypothetical protein
VRRFVQALPNGVEFAVVIFGAFGYLLASVSAVPHPDVRPPISQQRLEFLLLYETIVLLALRAYRAPAISGRCCESGRLKRIGIGRLVRLQAVSDACFGD